MGKKASKAKVVTSEAMSADKVVVPIGDPTQAEAKKLQGYANSVAKNLGSESRAKLAVGKALESAATAKDGNGHLLVRKVFPELSDRNAFTAWYQSFAPSLSPKQASEYRTFYRWHRDVNKGLPKDERIEFSNGAAQAINSAARGFQQDGVAKTVGLVRQLAETNDSITAQLVRENAPEPRQSGKSKKSKKKTEVNLGASVDRLLKASDTDLAALAESVAGLKKLNRLIRKLQSATE